jgi:succinate dehydrogenase flavin-adding protein (antitoxin of CptAB toxin-antitoxin module)
MSKSSDLSDDQGYRSQVTEADVEMLEWVAEHGDKTAPIAERMLQSIHEDDDVEVVSS